MLQDGHNKPEQVLIQNEYISHKYDITDKSNIVTHQIQNDYHPIIHDNDLAYWFPKNKFFNKIKSTKHKKIIIHKIF